MQNAADTYATAYDLLEEQGEEARSELALRADELLRQGKKEARFEVLSVLSAVDVLLDMDFRGPVH